MDRKRVTCLVASLAVTLAVVAAVRTAAQAGQTAAPATGVIAGRVVDAVSGAPVVGATVILNGITPAGPSAAGAGQTVWRPGGPRPGYQTTNETGRFEYTSLPAGRFRLSTRAATGYCTGYWGMQTPWDTVASNPQHELGAGERLTDQVIKLWPSGSISGTVRDERGEPIVKASVRLLEREQTGTAARWRSTVVSATTDDRGMFRLGDRPLLGNTDGIVLAGPGPGEYVVVVTAPAAAPGAGPVFGGSVFSGGTRSTAGAQVIPLGIGEHRTGVGIAVPAPGAGSFPVSGRLVSNVPMRAPLSVQLIPSDAVGDLINFQPITTTADAQGGFVFTPVPSGSYRPATRTLRPRRGVPPDGPS